MRGRRGPAVEHAPGVARREAQPAAVEEQRLGRRPVGEQVAAAPLDPSSQGVDRRLAEGHGTLLAALAPDRGATPAEVEVADVERAELTDPQAAPVEHLENGVVARSHPRRSRGANGQRVEQGGETLLLEHTGAPNRTEEQKSKHRSLISN